LKVKGISYKASLPDGSIPYPSPLESPSDSFYPTPGHSFSDPPLYERVSARFLADHTAGSMIGPFGHWHDNVVCLSVGDAVHCG